MKNVARFLYVIPRNFGVVKACEGEDDEEKEKAALEKTTKLVNEIVHKALTERDKRNEKTMQKLIADGIAAGIATLEEKIKPPAPGPDDKGKGGKGTESEEYKTLAAKMAKIEKERDEEKKLRTEAETKALRTEEARYMSTLLTENKVRPTMLAMATRDLHARHLVRDEAGEIKWKNADGELVDPKVGWAEFAKTDEGKDLIMPKDAGGGAGSRNSGGAQGGGKPGEFTFGDLGARLLPKNT